MLSELLSNDILHRKQLHGHLQLKRKKQIEINVESQNCVLEKIIFKYPTISVHNDVNPNNLIFYG